MGGGITISSSGLNLSGHYSQRKSFGEDFSNATIMAGGGLKVTTAGDLTVLGGSLKGDTVQVDVGGDLDLVSVQDWQKTRGFSVSGGITIGPNGVLPDSFGLGQVKGNKSWSEVSEIVGRGDTIIRVGGNLDLKGATIASTQKKLDLTAGSLSFSDNADVDTYLDWSFGVSGLSKLPGVLSGEGRTPGKPSLFGGFNGSYESRTMKGTTFATLGEGKIAIGGEENPLALAKINRDVEGRQVVTVNEGTKFSFDIPLVDFNQLSQNASSAYNLMRALTTPVPDDVAVQGSAATDYYRRGIAGGMTPDEVRDWLEKAEVQKLVTISDEFRKAVEAYGSLDAIPPGVRAAISDGLKLSYENGKPVVVADCQTAGAGCVFDVIQPGSLERARVIVADAEAKLQQLLPEFNELQERIKSGTASPEDRSRFSVIQGDLELAAKTYALCSDNVGKPPLWMITDEYSDSTWVRRIVANASEYTRFRDQFSSGKADTADEVFALLPPLRFAEGLAVVSAVIRNGVREFVTEGGEVLGKEAVDRLLRTGLAYVDEKTGELVVRQSQERFLAEMTAGLAREALVRDELKAAYTEANVQREVYLRNADGSIARAADGSARRIDFAVIENGEVRELVEVTSRTARKGPQEAKEQLIRDSGGTYIRDRNTGRLIDISKIDTRLDRRP